MRKTGQLLAPWTGGGDQRPLHVVGASGAEGVALLIYLAGELGLAGVVAHDFAADEREFAASFRRANTAWEREEREALLGTLRRLPVRWRLGPDYLGDIEDAGLIFAGQNWFNYPANLPALPDALAAGVALRGVVDLAMDLFAGPRIGVTGSNGKSTTAGLVAHLLRAALPPGQALHHGGNDRNAQATLRALAEAGPQDRLVWEVSNRHLRDRVVPVDVAVLTNVTHNHIEDHGTFEAYVAAKARLLQGDERGGHAVLTAADPGSRRLTESARRWGRTIWWAGATPDDGPPEADSEDGFVWSEGDVVRVQGPSRCTEEGGRAVAGALGSIRTFTLPGPHNRQNLLSAVAGALAAGAIPAQLATAWATFRSLPGRLELVAEAGGVRWFYDIAATTAPAAEVGLRGLGADGSRLVLIVGGEDKGMDFSGMADAAATYARLVLALPGSGTEAFLLALGQRVKTRRVDDIDAALLIARSCCEEGDAVLLSPGCAFFQSRFLTPGPPFSARVRTMLRSAE